MLTLGEGIVKISGILPVLAETLKKKSLRT